MQDIPIYRSISLDIAYRIIKGEFPVSKKISGRTLLASQYKVSPETIRKAIGLLKEEKIVEVSQGKEIMVISVDEAYQYVNKFKYMKSVYSLKQDLENLLIEKKKIDRKFEDILKDIINFSDRLRNLTPYNPVEVKIPKGSHLIGTTIADHQLWQNTGATVIALRRDTEVTISPGPHVILLEGDTLVVVGDDGVFKRMNNFVNQS
jgi:K+/H+ antiporter YhaU regulatory subunit KhtT